MKFGAVPLEQAAGAILAHSEQADRRIPKGTVLTPSHLEQLAAAGVARVTVARLEPGDVPEDLAADRLAAALLGANPTALGLRATAGRTGRVNLLSEVAGLADVDADRIDALNAIDPMITVATVPRWQRLGPGGMVATIKIIAFAVPEAALARAEALAAGALRMRPTALQTAALIQTSLRPGDAETGHRAIQKRCERLGLQMAPKTIVAHDEAALSDAILAAHEDLILILTASATSDPADTAPAALRRAGGEVLHFGMPVDPGNLLFLGRLAGRPVIGLPGCARSPALNGADWVLERVACGIPVSTTDITGLGVGGLLKDIPERGRRRDA